MTMRHHLLRWIPPLALFGLFVGADLVRIHLQIQHLMYDIPWARVVECWFVVILSTMVLERLMVRLVPNRQQHWSVLTLAIASGCAAGEALLSFDYGGLLGALLMLLVATATPHISNLLASIPFVLLWLFCRPVQLPLESHASQAQGPDIVVITIDTVREDALSHSPRALVPNLTPHLDAIATSGCHHDQASATSPLTGPSHAAMFSGMHPIELGLFRNGGTLPDDTPWLPDALHKVGYQTAAFVSSAMLEGDLGYRRGFDVYEDDQSGHAAILHSSLAPLFPPPRISKQDAFSRFGLKTIDKMSRWLKQADPAQPIFLWLHLYDAHRPYVSTLASQQFVENIALDLPAPESYSQWKEPKHASKEATMTQTIFSELRNGHESNPLKSKPNATSKTYLAGVRDLDKIVGTAWERIDTYRTKPRVWAVLADHGESLTEHGELGSHQHNVYEANLRVPYLLSGSHCPSGPVSTVNLAHDVLQQAELNIDWNSPTQAVEATVSAGKKAPSHPSTTKVSKRVGDHKMVVGLRDGNTHFTEVYDLAVDRHEERPLQTVPTALTDFVADIQARTEKSPETKSEDDSVNEALRALGYIEE